MLRRVLAVLKEACTSHWDNCEDPTTVSLAMSVTQVPTFGAVLEAAAVEGEKADAAKKSS